MTSELANWAVTAFMVFCRIGGCMMFAPGLSGQRVPMQFRLLLAAGVSLALVTLGVGDVEGRLEYWNAEQKLIAVVCELAIGIFIGMMARLFVVAIQFAATAAAASIGLAGIPGVPLDDSESGSPMATLAGLVAVTLIVVLDLHAELIAALADSYHRLPMGDPLSMDWASTSLFDLLSGTTMLALRLAAPFLVYGIVANVAVGLANRFGPQVTVYHSTTGVVMMGGLILVWFAVPDWFYTFVEEYQAWLTRGGM